MIDVAVKEATPSFVLFEREFALGDLVWDIPNDIPGTPKGMSTVKWDVELPDGLTLGSPKHAGLLQQLQIYLVTRILNPQSSSFPRPSTCGSLGRALETLASWMVASDIKAVSDISAELSWDYADFAVDAKRRVRAHLEPSQEPNVSYGEDVSFSTVWRDLNVLQSLFQQRNAMRDLGCIGMTEAPFDGRSAKAVVTQDLGIRRRGKLTPIPDDVAVPVLNAAVRMIGLPAKDVIALQKLHDDVRDLEHTAERLAKYKTNIQKIRAYEFATLDGEELPWREPIDVYERVYRDDRKFQIKESQVVRRLVVALQTACVITIQGLTGMRAHELIGVQVGDTLIDGLPDCVEVEDRRDGTVRKYFLKSETFKRRRRKERWLLGASLAGSNELPLPVRALLVLHELNAPWRRLRDSNQLLVTFVGGQGLPRVPESVGALTSAPLSIMQKEFVGEHVDLSAASEQSQREFADGAALRPHRWRTTFAMFVMRVSPRLLPALSQHYKHLNAVVTQEGYIGTNPALRDDMASARSQTSAEYLLRLTSPDAKLLGGGAKLFHEHAAALRAQMEAEPGVSLYDRALSLVERLELFVYDAAYGKCLSAFAPHASRCNRLAGYAGSHRPYPNAAFRSPETCTQCELLVITPEHMSYFEDRLEKAKLALSETSRSQEPGLTRVLQQRARQAKQILSVINRLEAEA